MKGENKMSVSTQPTILSTRVIGVTTIQEGQTSMREEATNVPQQPAERFYLCKSNQGLKMSGSGGILGLIGGGSVSIGCQANAGVSIAICSVLGCIYGGLGNRLITSAPDAAIYTDGDQNPNQAPNQTPEVYVMRG